MTKRRSSVIMSVGVLLCSFAAATLGRSTPPAATGGWPEQLGERRLHACEYGLVYARQKSSVSQMRKVLATVVKDVRQGGMAASGDGLILVVDTKEMYPCAAVELIDVLKEADPNVMSTEESAEGLKAMTSAQKAAQDLGLDLSTLLCFAPIPIHPRILNRIISGLPADAAERIGWCAIVPTDRCLKATFKKTVDAAVKKEKPSLAERAAMTALMPLIERKALSTMKKGRQAGFYSLFVNGQKDLSPEQRRQKAEAYKEKIGLHEDFNPGNEKNSPPEPQEDETDSE